METCLSKAFPLIVGIVLLFSLIVWDMDKQHDLSNAIHDDHHDIWEPMSTHDMYSWFSDTDICLLRGLSSHPTHHSLLPIEEGTSVKKYRLQNCTSSTSISARVPLSSNKLICAVGMSLGRSCSVPFPSDSFYFHKLKQKHLGDPLSSSLNIAVERLRDHSIPLIFIGDDVSKQNEESLICEAIRTNKKGSISVLGNLDLNLRENISNISITWSTHPDKKLFVYFIKLNKVNKNKFTLISEYVDMLRNSYKSIVVIANVGLHYKSREKFRADIDPFLNYLNQIGSNPSNLILYRETSSQHWNISANGYLDVSSVGLSIGCSPLEDASYDSDWKNKDVKNLIINAQLHSIHVIPFRDLTAPLFNMHIPKDCNQFCYFPQLWQIVYYYLERYSVKISHSVRYNNSQWSNSNVSKLIFEDSREKLLKLPLRLGDKLPVVGSNETRVSLVQEAPETLLLNDENIIKGNI